MLQNLTADLLIVFSVLLVYPLSDFPRSSVCDYPDDVFLTAACRRMFLKKHYNGNAEAGQTFQTLSGQLSDPRRAEKTCINR